MILPGWHFRLVYTSNDGEVLTNEFKRQYGKLFYEDIIEDILGVAGPYANGMFHYLLGTTHFM